MSVSRRAVSCRSEGIDGVGRRGAGYVGFEGLAVDDIDRAVEQARDIVFQPDIPPYPAMSVRIELDQDVCVAVVAFLTPRARAEESRMRDAPGTQRRFVLPQSSNDGFAIHGATIAHNKSRSETARLHRGACNNVQSSPDI